MQEVFKGGEDKREDVFMPRKLWNKNHRPERVKPAFEAESKATPTRLRRPLLIHTPFAFQPGD